MVYEQIYFSMYIEVIVICYLVSESQVLEIMAFKADMRKIMLTCFKHNPAAQKFFKTALKYEIDETCPTDDVYEQNDYEVIYIEY